MSHIIADSTTKTNRIQIMVSFNDEKTAPMEVVALFIHPNHLKLGLMERIS
jgi:hypothetical protein